MSETEGGHDVFHTNPYEGHPHVSALEAEVLWEYAKLSQQLKDLNAQTKKLSDNPDTTTLPRLRELEGKMGLVLTLFKASVWGVINDSEQSG